MSTAFSATDLEILGYDEVHVVPLSEQSQHVLFEAKVHAGLETHTHTFLYLKSDCTIESLSSAVRSVSGRKSLYVVFPRSLKISKATLQARFSGDAKIFEQEDLIWGRLKVLFSDYLASVSTDVATEPYYIPPRRKDADAKHRLDNELLDYLQGRGPIKPGELAVVCAPAAVGKTTLSRHLLRQLVDGIERFKIIPTYVESSHWGRLQLESADDLWDIIRNSLATFSSTLSFPQELFEYALRQGYICFIFDGFDELCGHRSAQFNATDVLGDLARIAEQSEARIILTTRTLYWQAEIGKPPSNARTLELDSFNTQQARGYFSLFFKSEPKKLKKASELYDAVVEGSYKPRTMGGARAQFVNLPVCVVMVAQFVQAEGTELRSSQRPGRLLDEILEAICAREVARKKLATLPRDQLLAFEAIAIDQSSAPNPEFDLGLLEATGVQAADIPKLVDHPLLTRGSGANYKFNYDFLAPFFRATFLERFMSRGEASASFDAWKLMARESHGKGFILEHLVSLMPYDCLDTLKERYAAIPQMQREARSFLFHLANLILTDDPTTVGPKERTKLIFQVLGAREDNGVLSVTGCYIQGPMESLNLERTTFTGCTFRDVTFAKSRADHTTSFTRCAFAGEITVPAEIHSWKKVKLDNCTFVPPANLAWENIISGTSANRDQNVRDIIKLALDKFWHHGRLLGSITKSVWKRGILGRTRYARLVEDAFLKVGLMARIEISGVSEGGYAFDRSSIPDLQRFMDNRQLTGKIKHVYEMLIASDHR